MKSSITRTIFYKRAPVDGKDAVLYRLVPSYSSVNIRRVNGKLVPDVSFITFRVTKQCGDDSPTTVKPADWSKEGLTVGITYLAGDTTPHLYAGENIEVKAEYKGVTAVISRGGTNIDTCTVGFIIDGADGVQGSRGPTLRGPQLWEECPERFQFENGSEGSKYVDLVMHDGHFWQCSQSHRKSSATEPNAASAYWSVATELNFVATMLFLAKYALIKNLGVEAIEMKNEHGNVLCLIKDGKVICNCGTFKNIDVSGNITAESLSLEISVADDYAEPNGSLIINRSNIILPALPPFTSRSIKVLNAMTTRSPAENLVFEGADQTVAITLGLNELGAQPSITIPGGGRNAGKAYDLLGINEFGAGTTWFVTESYSTN